MTSHYGLYVKYNNIRKSFKFQQKLFLNYKKITEIFLNLGNIELQIPRKKLNPRYIFIFNCLVSM